MDIISDWQQIREHFRRSFSTNFFAAVASVNKNNMPTVTPIGSLFLMENQSGFYFEKYPTKLPEHAQDNTNICVLAVNSSSWFWLRSLYRGSFKRHPAIKLYGTIGNRREAMPEEVRRLKRRMRATKGFRGNTYLWGDMNTVRELTFSHVEKINLGKMTAHL